MGRGKIGCVFLLGLEFGAGAMIGVLGVRYVLQVVADVFKAGVIAYREASRENNHAL